MKKQLKIPKFKNEDDELNFWSKTDLSDYFEPKDFTRVSFLKPWKDYRSPTGGDLTPPLHK